VTKFAHIAKSTAADNVVEYPISQIAIGDKTPVLLVKCAVQSNKAYLNAVLSRTPSLGRIGKSMKVSLKQIERNRRNDRELYPEHIVMGWKHVVDADGAEVPFSKEDCHDFLNAIDDWIFDELREFCRDPMNFVSDFPVDSEAVEARAKNSPSGSSGS
jgi:hypothetical protein